MRDDETGRAERVALFRYGLISDLVHPGDETRGLYRLREKAAKSNCIPGSRRTLRDWLGAYKASGFDALRPKPRADIGHAGAIPQPLADLRVMLKDEHRDWSVAMVIDAAPPVAAFPASAPLGACAMNHRRMYWPNALDKSSRSRWTRACARSIRWKRRRSSAVSLVLSRYLGSASSMTGARRCRQLRNSS
ncbi:MAG: hypothetical protein ABTD50_22820 [Polyangiaceae bacterium]|jgi:hypothetical protein